jgi:hypothetical protein
MSSAAETLAIFSTTTFVTRVAAWWSIVGWLEVVEDRDDTWCDFAAVHAVLQPDERSWDHSALLYGSVQLNG